MRRLSVIVERGTLTPSWKRKWTEQRNEKLEEGWDRAFYRLILQFPNRHHECFVLDYDRDKKDLETQRRLMHRAYEERLTN